MSEINNQIGKYVKKMFLLGRVYFMSDTDNALSIDKDIAIDIDSDKKYEVIMDSDRDRDRCRDRDCCDEDYC